jgi:hypothetical protein
MGHATPRAVLAFWTAQNGNATLISSVGIPTFIVLRWFITVEGFPIVLAGIPDRTGHRTAATESSASIPVGSKTLFVFLKCLIRTERFSVKRWLSKFAETSEISAIEVRAAVNLVSAETGNAVVIHDNAERLQ